MQCNASRNTAITLSEWTNDIIKEKNTKIMYYFIES